MSALEEQMDFFILIFMSARIPLALHVWTAVALFLQQDLCCILTGRPIQWPLVLISIDITVIY